MKNSIKINLILKILLVIFIFIIFVITYSFHRSLNNLNQLLKNKCDVISDTIYINLTTNENVHQLKRLINYISASNNVTDLYIIDQNKMIISSLRANEINKNFNILNQKEMSAYKNLLFKSSLFTDHYYCKTNFNINNHSKLNSVQIFLKLNIDKEKNVNLSDIYFIIIYSLFILFFFSLSIYYFVNEEILIPIIRATNYCHAFGKGLNLPKLKYPKFKNEIYSIYESLEVMVQDIQDQTQKLELAKKVAQTDSIAKTRFLSCMSHEIRTPLNAVIGFTTLLKHMKLSEEQSQYLDYIMKSSKYLLELINDILEFSKIEAGKLDIKNQSVNLRNLIHEITTTINFKSKNENCHFIVDLGGIKENNVVLDALKFSQVLINLVSNAAKFTHEGSVKLEVSSTRIEQDKSSLVINVIDTGIGIEEEDLVKLFSPFVQIDKSSTRKYGGTGLGLVISSNLIKLMGGELKCKSQINHGTTFSIYLTVPISESFTVKDQKINDRKINQSIKDYSSFCILVVEDNILNQKLMKSYLQKFNINCDMASNGKEAIDKMAKNKYKIIFMDIQMPEMDGLECTKLIREMKDYDSVYICGLSANAFVEDKDLAIKSGMNDYLTKPVSLDKIAEVLAKVIDG